MRIVGGFVCCTNNPQAGGALRAMNLRKLGKHSRWRKLYCMATTTKEAVLKTTSVVLVTLAFSVGCAEAKATTPVTHSNFDLLWRYAAMETQLAHEPRS
jgi:hypothetical protein